MASASSSWALWVDRLGGYLVCRSDRISMGSSRPIADSDELAPDIPLLAPLRPIHLWLQRDREGYVWQAVGRCRYLGREWSAGRWAPNTALSLLTDTGEEAARLHLYLPDPALLTARLTWSPPIRAPLHFQAALLVSQALHLGPAPTAHVRSELLPETWLFPTYGGWLLRSAAPVVFVQRQSHGEPEATSVSPPGEVQLPTCWQIRIAEIYLRLESFPAP
ncbi:hypothetical protein HRbin36_02457 [bacterium HR36]|nr:hypothetical protein HRbin36_02457 [bacterium HR36]